MTLLMLKCSPNYEPRVNGCNRYCLFTSGIIIKVLCPILETHSLTRKLFEKTEGSS